MWRITGWIHNKRRNRLVQLSVEKAVRVHDNLVLRKVMMERHKMWLFGTVRLQSLNRNRYTDEQGTDDVDEEDSAD